MTGDTEIHRLIAFEITLFKLVECELDFLDAAVTNLGTEHDSIPRSLGVELNLIGIHLHDFPFVTGKFLAIALG
jgi:hypothetical protein